MRSAFEGDVEPVFWQGIRVGSVKKFDNRLRIELLRAHMPKTFATPGAKVNINTGDQFNVLQIGEKEQNELIEMRQRSLARIAEKRQLTLSGGTVEMLPVPTST